jgi:hypothetical protein
MNFKIANRAAGDVHISEDWLPPREIINFVQDAVKHRVGSMDLSLAQLDHRWIPLGIIGTLFWLEVTEWWIMENSGIRITGESHDARHVYDTSKLDPAQLVVLRHLHEELEKARELRWDNPGLEQSEVGELLGFLRRQCYESSGVKDPPIEIITAIAWGTLLYILEDEGQDWIAKISDTFKVTLHQQVAFQSTEISRSGEPELLYTPLVEKTTDGLGTCQRCGHKLFCVRGHAHSVDGSPASWVDLCHKCALDEIEFLEHFDLTKLEDVNTMCHFDEDGRNLDCASHRCPHALDTAIAQFQGWTNAKLKQRGTQQLLAFEEVLNQRGGLINRGNVDKYLTYFGES